MTLVHDGIGDLVLFSKDQPYMDLPNPRPEENFNHLPYTTESEMQQSLQDLANSAYLFFQPTSQPYGSTSNYHEASQYLLDVSKDVDRMTRPYTPSGTPSPSISQSIENPPSILSTASAASGPSTASSIAGSPYSLAANSGPSQDLWNESNQELAMPSNILRHEDLTQDVFALTNLDSTLGSTADKFTGSFVGEFSKISSSSVSPNLSMSSFTHPSLASQPGRPACTGVPFAIDTSVVNRPVITDSVLGEGSRGINTPALDSSASVYSTKAPLAGPSSRCPQSSPNPPRGSFKSPTTPASAMSPFSLHSISPSKANQLDRRQNTTSACSTPKSPLSSPGRFHPYSRPSPSLSSQNHFPCYQPQSNFFCKIIFIFFASFALFFWFSFSGCLLFFFFFFLLLFPSFSSHPQISPLGEIFFSSWILNLAIYRDKADRLLCRSFVNPIFWGPYCARYHHNSLCRSDPHISPSSSRHPPAVACLISGFQS